MKKPVTILVMLTGLFFASALAGCSDSSGEPESDRQASVTSGEQIMPVEPDGGSGDGASPPPAANASDARAKGEAANISIPTPVRGTWREVEIAVVGEQQVKSVTRAQCDSSDYGNAGKILTIEATSFTFFESGGRLIEVNERDASRIDATYDTTYADTPTQGRYIFDAQNGGKQLVVREASAGGRPGPILYLRCPA